MPNDVSIKLFDWLVIILRNVRFIDLVLRSVRVIDLSLEIRCSDWLSRSGDNQVICYKTGVIDLLLVSKTSSDLVCLSLSLSFGRENEFALLILLLVLFSLSYFLEFDVRE